MGKSDDVVQAKQARRAFDGVRSAEHRVDDFAFLLCSLYREQASFHIFEQLAALDDEQLKGFIKIHQNSLLRHLRPNEWSAGHQNNRLRPAAQTPR